jgi:hypothetical protein
MNTTDTDETEKQTYIDMRDELSSGECVTINAKGEVFFERKHLCTIGAERAWRFGGKVKRCQLSRASALKQVREEMERLQYWPNIYEINDHGNVSLLDTKGNIVQAWV